MPDHTHSRPITFPWRALLFIQLAALAGLAAFVWQQLQPVTMHDLHLAEGERLKCVSYAPYRLPGQTPFNPNLSISRQQIVDDLTALSRISECVRVYSVAQGQDQTPAVARELGMKVLLGAWIGADSARNQIELDHAIRIANEYPDVVTALIVGNEVLLRREQTVGQLQTLLDYAKANARVPVTYADVWEFWTHNDTLAEKVDFVTVHILPFWEDNPVDIDNAVAHVGRVFEQVQAHFAKPVMIGETGWPSAGRQREGSLPSSVNQARYVREFIHLAHDQGWNYNLIEAIDQPWKRLQEGTVGGFWGILDTELQPKFPLAGPVSERHSPGALILGGALGALICLTLALTAHGPRRRDQLLAVGTGGALAGIVAILQWEHALVAYRNVREWSVLGGTALLSLSIPILLARWPAERAVPSLRMAWRECKDSPRAILDVTNLLGLMRGLLLFAATIAALLLFADPRYRDFPSLLYLIPAVTFGVIGWKQLSFHGSDERICAWIIALAATARWLGEPANPQAVTWLAVALGFASPTLRRRACKNE